MDIISAFLFIKQVSFLFISNNILRKSFLGGKGAPLKIQLHPSPIPKSSYKSIANLKFDINLATFCCILKFKLQKFEDFKFQGVCFNQFD